ncbi:hypothetical protein SESBI_28915 [Sesbania bispinosa]|nr:hypothetical protein SESBI_28915 [Sesbania bispinosa]
MDRKGGTTCSHHMQQGCSRLAGVIQWAWVEWAAPNNCTSRWYNDGKVTQGDAVTPGWRRDLVKQYVSYYYIQDPNIINNKLLPIDNNHDNYEQKQETESWCKENPHNCATNKGDSLEDQSALNVTNQSNKST